MIETLTKEEFLSRALLEVETWDKANIDWEELKKIGIHHENEHSHLENSAELFAKEMQKFDGVHSVRWRIKNPLNLLKKIIRKRAENNQKYSEISVENYHEIVTDLVGIRALHLFKLDCLIIDSSISNIWTFLEKPVAYIRTGDSEELKEKFKENGFDIKEHPAGYRSIHYVIESKPLKRKIFTEIQVRTIFEEGWSEIDHTVRYPNFSNNELLTYFLEIFNRMAGSADDMGGFVLGLVAKLNQFEEKIGEITKEKESNFNLMEEALNQLEAAKKQDEKSKLSIATLKEEIAKIKKSDIPVFDPKAINSKNSIHELFKILGRQNLSSNEQLDEALKSQKLFLDSLRGHYPDKNSKK